MPKKLKLNIEDIKVQSFVTSLTDDEKKDVNAGTESGATCIGTSCQQTCDTFPVQSYCLSGCTGTECTFTCPNC